MLEQQYQQIWNHLCQTVLMIPINFLFFTQKNLTLKEVAQNKNWPAIPENIMKIPENFKKYFSYIYTAMVKRWGSLSEKIEKVSGYYIYRITYNAFLSKAQETKINSGYI